MSQNNFEQASTAARQRYQEQVRVSRDLIKQQLERQSPQGLGMSILHNTQGRAYEMEDELKEWLRDWDK